MAYGAIPGINDQAPRQQYEQPQTPQTANKEKTGPHVPEHGAAIPKTPVQEKSGAEGNYMKLGEDRQTKELTEAEIRFKKKTGEIECQACSSRRYVDVSDDAGVSFQTPTHVPAAQSGQAVMSHEMEHVASNRAQAAKEGREVVSSSVTTSQAICGECGRAYTSGGTTTTTTRKAPDSDTLQDLSDKRNGLGLHLSART